MDIATLKAKVLLATTQEEIAAVWGEVQALQSRAAIPAEHPAVALLAEGGPWTWRAEALKHGEGESETTTAGERTPTTPRSSSSFGEKQSKSAAESDDESPRLTIRNTFIDLVEEEEECFVPKRRAQSCPASPLSEPERSLETLSEAARQLRLLQQAPEPSSPVAEAINAQPRQLSLASYIEDTTSAQASELTEQQRAMGMPSVGSLGHAVGRCKPCAFFHTKGCSSGESCLFCHLCEPGCAKRRKKAWKQHQQQNLQAWRNHISKIQEVPLMVQPGVALAYPSPTAWVVCPR